MTTYMGGKFQSSSGEPVNHQEMAQMITEEILPEFSRRIALVIAKYIREKSPKGNTEEIIDTFSHQLLLTEKGYNGQEMTVIIYLARMRGILLALVEKELMSKEEPTQSHSPPYPG